MRLCLLTHRCKKPRQTKTAQPGPDRLAADAEVPGADHRVGASDQIVHRQQADAALAQQKFEHQQRMALLEHDLKLREHTMMMAARAAELAAKHPGAAVIDLGNATLLPGEGEDADSEPALLPLLKHQLNEWRWIILNPKQALPQLQRESELRRATGDTQKLRLLKFQKSGK